MALAVSLHFSTLLLLITAFFARNTQAIITKDFLERKPAVDAELGQLPWLALLEIPGNGFRYCTGTIISPTSVLSAALCLNIEKMPLYGTAYAGNVKYTKHSDFDPPTQKRSIVEYHLYDRKNPFFYNFMLVKIDPKWTWTQSVHSIGIVESQRLLIYFPSKCSISGLGYGSNTEEDNKVARTADVHMGNWRICMNHTQEHRMCNKDANVTGPCQGDLGGSVLCKAGSKSKLYGIISEFGHSEAVEDPDHCKLPSHPSGFQFVGYYLSWIRKTAQDLPSAVEVETIRKQYENEEHLPTNESRLSHVMKHVYGVMESIVKLSVQDRGMDETTAAPATATGAAVVPDEGNVAGSTVAGSGVDEVSEDSSTTADHASHSFVANCFLPFIMLLAATCVSGSTLY